MGIRVLIIDKTAGLHASHERHCALAAQPDIDLHVLGPRHWIENGRDVVWNPPLDCPYAFQRGLAFGKGHYARAGYYSGLIRAMRCAKPDVIQLLEEPWSISALQVLSMAPVFAPQAKILFYTWENIHRPWTYPARASMLYKQIDQAMHRHSAAAVCATQEAREVLLQKGYAKPAAVIPYGIPSFFLDQPEAAIADHPKFTVGYIGRMLEMKGVDLLLNAAAKSPGIRLLLAGDGEDRERFQNQAQSLNIQGRVEWHDPVDETKIPELMRRMDIFVLPSRTTNGWKEQLGRVAIEAMACGVPVVGSSSGAIPEIIAGAGLVFQENNADDLAAKIEQIKNDAPSGLAMAQAGRKRAQERFSWPRFAEELSHFYHGISK